MSATVCVCLRLIIKKYYQMDHKEAVAIEYKHNPFYHPLHTNKLRSVDGSNRRLCGTQKKRVCKADLLERLALDKDLKTLNVY